MDSKVKFTSITNDFQYRSFLSSLPVNFELHTISPYLGFFTHDCVKEERMICLFYLFKALVEKYDLESEDEELNTLASRTCTSIGAFIASRFFNKNQEYYNKQLNDLADLFAANINIFDKFKKYYFANDSDYLLYFNTLVVSNYVSFNRRP